MKSRRILLQGVVRQQDMFPTVQIAMIMTIPYIREQQRSAMVRTMIAMDRLMKVVRFRRVRIVKRAAHIRRDSMESERNGML